MAFQFVPSCHDRNHDRPRQAVMSSSHANYSDDWIAQQSLFMGSSTPLYRRQVSMSPQDTYPAPSRYYAPAVQGPITSTDGISPCRVVVCIHLLRIRTVLLVSIMIL